MPVKPEKSNAPAIVSYSSLINFVGEMREGGVIPTRIDKSLLPKASGSQSSAMLASLRYLGWISETGQPTEEFRNFVQASDEDRRPIMAAALKRTYSFLFADDAFDLEKATSGEMAEIFRSLDISGSTVTKAIAFFLAAAKEAGIKVSSYIRPPAAPKSSGAQRRANKRVEPSGNAPFNSNNEDDEGDEDVERFEIPIPGKSSVKVIVPSDLDADDWAMLQSMITVYIRRWKNFKDEGDPSS